MGPQRNVGLGACVKDAILKCAGRHPVPQMASGCEDFDIRIDADRFTSVLAHLIRNAQDATDGDGKVEISLSMAGEMARVLISDDGCGMEEDFVRSRLFRPFDTTKGSQGMGIGAYQARSFIVACGGTMIVKSVPGQGTVIELQIPVVMDNDESGS